MSVSTKYIDVILPLPLANVYTYSVPDEYINIIQKGMRVVVPFGNKKVYTGIIYNIHHILPENYSVKSILNILDEESILCRPQLKLWEWIALYYQCTLGDVYKAALPSGLKLESETLIAINSQFEEDIILKEDEEQVLSVFSKDKLLNISDIQKFTGIKNVLPVIKRLIDKQQILVREELKDTYQPKTETFVKISDKYSDENQMRMLFSQLEKSDKQLRLLMTYLELSMFLLKKEKKKEVSRKALLEKSGITTVVLNSLIKKNVFEVYKKEIGRLDKVNIDTVPIYPLNNFQEIALKNILTEFTQKNVVLLHGVTSSGKTEIYIHLIQEALKRGQQVLYLLPEIALTTQITTRLKKVFGNKLGIYHSKFSDNERVEIWNNLRQNKGYEVILGVRSSIFLPFSHLGLVIVDEEHENTYKQYDPAPRYHARNAAIVLASMHGAKTLLGTATPSIESYQNALSGKYGFVELKERYESIELPEIITVDIKEMKRKKLMKSHFSPLLLEKVNEALQNKEQVILFQNRRGFAPYVECTACAWVPKCKNCDVSLTYHKAFNQLNCHYCGYTYTIPAVCPACGNATLTTKGFGTEKIELEIENLFPEAKVARLDLDAARSKKAYEKIIDDFENQKIDILVGTQMISKGLDFEKVSIVGVMNADNLLNFPDFRAHERAYQLLTQVSGRAGRKNKRGLVVIQTSEPNHPIIQQVIANDFISMFQQQMSERELFKYPPFYRLMYLYVKHRDSAVVNRACFVLAEQLKKTLGNRILGPDIPQVSRVKNLFIKRFMIKIEVQSSSDKAKQIIRDIIKSVQQQDEFKSIIVNFDIDPM